MRKILVVGSGGREHAICWAFRQGSEETKLFCASGNAGISQIAENINTAPTDVKTLARFAESNHIDLTFVGGENSLVAGIVNEFQSRRLKIIGASQEAARLEASKIFAKDFMFRHKIPTARYRAASSAENALMILKSGEFGDENTPVVVKADGLAAGKGVVVAANRAEAIQAIEDLMIREAVGKEAASRIVLEECLFGKEISLLLFADGKDFALMPAVRDHKRIGEGNTGANTGGMGTLTDDANLLSEDEKAAIIKEIILPTLNGCEDEGFPFRGILFLGLMLTPKGAKVLEYNVRFGDPETQAILIRLETDFLEVCDSIIEQRLGRMNVKFRDESSACIALASKGYPQDAETGDVIYGLENATKHQNIMVFHAGTAFNEKREFITNGGRVLGVTATGENLSEALNRAYSAVGEISWSGMQFRRDIGKY